MYECLKPYPKRHGPIVKKNEVVRLVAGSTKPKMLDSVILGSISGDANHSSIAKIAEFSAASRIEAFVDHNFSWMLFQAHDNIENRK